MFPFVYDTLNTAKNERERNETVREKKHLIENLRFEANKFGRVCTCGGR